MKRTAFLMTVALIFISSKGQHDSMAGIQETINDIEHVNYTVFKPGERLEYVVHYGIVNAGKAIVEVKETDIKLGQKPLYHMVGQGFSTGAFDWFFKVRDRYESYMEPQTLNPYLFIRRVDEGGYHINQDYKFFQTKNRVDTQDDKSYEVPYGIQDMISSFYFARTIDFDTTLHNEVYRFYAFVDNEIEPLGMRYLGKETIKTKSGTFNCLKFQPRVIKGAVFEEEDDLIVYVTDDKNRIPVLVEAKILVGSVKMELLTYEGLAHPVKALKAN